MRTHTCRGQKGTVLVIGLIFLLLMTIVGSVAIQSTNLDERMAGNLRNRNIAFQAAEAALREGEANKPADLIGSYLISSEPDPNDDSTWTNTHEYSGQLHSDEDNSIKKPIYVIEEIFSYNPGTGSGGIYRVTSKGFGADPDAVVVLQSIVGIWTD